MSLKVLFKTGQNFDAHETLVWSTYAWRTATFFKKRVIYKLGIHFNQIRFI